MNQDSLLNLVSLANSKNATDFKQVFEAELLNRVNDKLQNLKTELSTQFAVDKVEEAVGKNKEKSDVVIKTKMRQALSKSNPNKQMAGRIKRRLGRLDKQYSQRADFSDELR